MEYEPPTYYGKLRRSCDGPAVDVAKLRGVWIRRMDTGIEIKIPASVRSWLLSTHFADDNDWEAMPFKAFGKCFSVNLYQYSLPGFPDEIRDEKARV